MFLENVALADRIGLPDALRVLLAEYPRDAWETDPGFDGLMRFWLERHLMFRRILKEIQGGTEELLDRSLEPSSYVAMVSRYGGMFVGGLHEHHTIEDTYYFPKIAKLDPRIEKGFAILDKDHHDIDGFIAAFVTQANSIIDVQDDRETLQDRAGPFQTELVRLDGLLNRHLVDEEELIVPAILKYGFEEAG
ncbi:MAG: hemerythrin domain-containing protein [Pseudomonadota bacterium]